MATTTRKDDEVLHEYPQVGKYKVRVIRSHRGSVSVDVREYVQSDTFEGFTRRGVRLQDKNQIAQLRDALTDAAGRGWFE